MGDDHANSQHCAPVRYHRLYIENNVNNMADVKVVLKLYGKMIAFGARKR